MLIDSDRYQPHRASGIKGMTLRELQVSSPLSWNAACFFSILLNGFIIIISSYWYMDLHSLLLQKENVGMWEICFLRILFSRLTFIAVCCWFRSAASVATDHVIEAVLSSEGKLLSWYYPCSDCAGVTCLQSLLLNSWKWYKNLEFRSLACPTTLSG